GQHRRCAARRHLHRRCSVAQQLLCGARVWPDVLLYSLPARDDLSAKWIAWTKGRGDDRNQRLRAGMSVGVTHQSSGRRTLPFFPRRGTPVSVLEILLLVVCVALTVVGLPQSLQDVAVLTFLWAGLALAWNIAGGYAGLIS